MTSKKMQSEYKIIIIIFISSINFNCDLFSQKYSVGISTEVGYEFYSQFLNSDQKISKKFNPTLGIGMISEIQSYSGMLVFLGFNINKSQRKYLYTYSEYFEPLDFHNWYYEDVTKIINSYNFEFGLGYRKKKFKIALGSQITKFLKVEDYEIIVTKIRGINGIRSSKQIELNSESKTKFGFSIEAIFLVSNKMSFSLKYILYSGRNSYLSNAPLGRFTIGAQNFLFTKKVSTSRKSIN